VKTLCARKIGRGWAQRIRSYSMNTMVGNPGTSPDGGTNEFNPNYRQFLKITQITQPTEIFVFLDEHPDSIDDGAFFNQPETVTGWINLPASYHNNSGVFSFADGSCSLHRWREADTLRPVELISIIGGPAIPVPTGATSDFDWVTEHMSTKN
jgi:prepilin-type processing-associated H-X9-DG protein